MQAFSGYQIPARDPIQIRTTDTKIRTLDTEIRTLDTGSAKIVLFFAYFQWLTKSLIRLTPFLTPLLTPRCPVDNFALELKVTKASALAGAIMTGPERAGLIIWSQSKGLDMNCDLPHKSRHSHMTWKE
jgi:hypothetical protein